MSNNLVTVKSRSFQERLITAIRAAIPSALRTGWWMIRLTLIVSFVVTLLQYLGVVGWLSQWLSPAFQLIGLPGESALVFISGYCVNIYSAIAVIVTLDFSVRSITILAVMCLCAHNMFIETAVQKKTGSSAIRIVLVRTLSAFILAFVLNLVMPENGTIIAAQEHTVSNADIWSILGSWAISAGKLMVKMMVLILSLNILQRVLSEFGVIRLLSKGLKPVMLFFGLPIKTAFLWIVANILGLAYGSAVMIEEREQGKISKEDADLLNHHISISHSNLEDVILFVSVGALLWWMLLFRWAMSAIIVWLRRLELAVKN